MSRTDLTALADQSLADCIRHFARHAASGSVADDGGLLRFAGADPYPGAYVNGMLRLDPALGAERALSEADRFFAPRRRGYAIWARVGADDDIAERALRAGCFLRPPEDGMPAMVCDRPPSAPPMAPGVRFERIADHLGARLYLGVVADAYGVSGVPPERLEGMFFHTDAVLTDEVAAYLVWLHGRPAAGAMAVSVAGVAGTFWAATAPWAAGHGLGDASLRLATRAGFDAGAHLAVCQSSQRGFRRWQQMGYREVARYRRYLAPPPELPPVELPPVET